jgi:hypothetical protein
MKGKPLSSVVGSDIIFLRGGLKIRVNLEQRDG